MKTVLNVACAITVVAILALTGYVRGQAASPLRIAVAESALNGNQSNAAALAELRDWDQRVTQLTRLGELQVSSSERDALVAGRSHERFAQHYNGIRVWGADVTRQSNQFGQAVSIFGEFYPIATLDVTPQIGAGRARELLSDAGEGPIGPDSEFELLVLPEDNGEYRLTWSARVVSLRDAWQRRIFIDADTGLVVRSYNDTWTQTSSVGRGTGVIGDTFKVSAQAANGQFLAIDALRPGLNTTYDMKGDPVHTTLVIASSQAVASSDVASTSNNVWADGAVACIQAYGGMTYDYYRKRFNRSGLNNANIRFRLIGNPTRRENFASQSGTYPIFFNNAAYYSTGLAVFGSGGPTLRSFAASIDIVAHELSHGVTGYTSNLVYLNESGALNEAFSDMMGVSVEFMFQKVGSGPGLADWLQGEDVTPTGAGLRSLVSPNSLGAPDHYSLRFTGTADNGGVHTNSNIVNHMFYLAIVGGTHRLSGLSVQGVGFANREQIEQVIYRAFTQLLPSSATFSVARASTIQAARDLYGGGSAAERAITQAWTAVGVQ